uniref:5'-AMP-activated protein kinase subunit beta-1 n=1 Tax=Panagrellus redivivus TaxID=6233 RepID=A0A7E4VHE0_PANRE
MATGGPPEAATNGTPSWFTTNVYPVIEEPLNRCQEYSRSTILESIQWLRWWCHCPPKPLKLKPHTYIQTVATEAAKITDHVVPTKGAVKNLTDKLLGPDLSDGDAIGRNLTLAALKIVVVTLVVVLISYFVFGVRRMISRYRHTVQLDNFTTAADQIVDPMDLPIYEPRKENDHFNERRATKRIAGPAKTSFVQPPPDTIATGGLVPRPVSSMNKQQPPSENLLTLSCEEIVPPPEEKLKPVPPPATSSNSFSLSAVTSFFSTKSKPATTPTSNFTTAPGTTPMTTSNMSFKSAPSGSETSTIGTKDSISSTQVTVSTITPSTSQASTASTQAATTKPAQSPMVEKPSPDEAQSKKDKKKLKKKKRKSKKGSEKDEVAVTLIPSPKGKSNSRQSTSSPRTSLVVPPKRAQSPCRTPMAVPTKPPSIIADPTKMASPVSNEEKLVSFDPKNAATAKAGAKGGSDSANNSVRAVSAPKVASDDTSKSFADAKSANDKLDISTKKLPETIQECPTQQATDPTQSPSSSNREVPPTPVSSSEDNFKKPTSPLPKQTILNENEPPSDQHPLVPATPHASFANRKEAAKDATSSKNNGNELLSRAAEMLSNEHKTTRPAASGSDEPTELKWKGELRSNEQFSDSKPGTPPKTPQEMDDKTASRRGAGRDDTVSVSSNQSCDSFSSTVICTCEDCNKHRDEEENENEGRMAAGRSACEAEEFLSAQQDRFIQMQERIRQNTTALGILQMYPRGSTAAGCPECQTRRLHPITFRWYDDEPQSVFLTGSFVGWQSKIPMHRLIERRDGNARSRGFCLELRLPRGHHEYKFIVDKRWAVDEKRQPTIKTREGHMHHVIHV